MAAARVFGNLSVFDLLGNFIPGLIFLVTVSLTFPRDYFSKIYAGGLSLIFTLIIIAFIIGHLIQSYASQAVGTRETFQNSILINQSMGKSSVLDFGENPTAHPIMYCIYSHLHPNEPEEWNIDKILEDNSKKADPDLLDDVMNSTTVIGRFSHIPARWYRSVIEAVMMVRIKRDRPLLDVTLAGKTWAICRKKYDLDRHYDQYGDLLHLISSEIESQSVRSRSLRFQAIRNLYRGLWIAFYFSFVLTFFVWITRRVSNLFTPFFRYIGISIWKPVVVDLQIPVWLLSVGFLFLTYLFWELKEDFEDEFVEYLLSDFLAIYSDMEDDDKDPEWKRRDAPDWYN